MIDSRFDSIKNLEIPTQLEGIFICFADKLKKKK